MLTCAFQFDNDVIKLQALLTLTTRICRQRSRSPHRLRAAAAAAVVVVVAAVVPQCPQQQQESVAVGGSTLMQL